jgi:hypothetical protein
MLGYYGRLFSAKFQVLNQLESHLPYRCFEEEYRLLQQKGASKLLKIDKYAPVLLIVFFIFLAICHG